MKISELKGCPKCGGHNMITKPVYGKPLRWQIACEDCGCAAPDAGSLVEACKEWDQMSRDDEDEPSGCTTETHRLANQHGFTLVELLTVVAIIGILGALAVVNIVQHQRNMKFFEANNTAKEIFIAAQNHMSAEEMLGAIDGYENVGIERDDGAFLLLSQRSEAPAGNSVLSAFLPFASIDETVRIGGSYAILYDKNSANVMDVYYSSDYDIQAADIDGLKAASENERKFYSRLNANANPKAVIGWYGGTGLAESVDNYIEAPIMQVVNGDTLSVNLSHLPTPRAGETENPDRPGVSVIVTGMTSGAMRQYHIIESKSIGYIPHTGDGTACLVLDDITTASSHFAEVTARTILSVDGSLDFIPGEDIEVRALAYDNTKRSNIAESGRVVVNSLFGYVEPGKQTFDAPTIKVSSIRHLENLNKEVSGVSFLQMQAAGIINLSTSLNIVQTSDMNWTTFPNNRSEDTIPSIYFNNSLTANYADEFYPIRMSNSVQYDGTYHQIMNVHMHTTSGNCGLFCELTGSVRNLELNGISVRAEGEEDKAGNAGALAGSMTGTIENVVAHMGSDTNQIIESKAGSAGGLVGTMTGNASYAAAAIPCQGSSSAGGLFGTASGTYTHCYSGGMTVDGKYDEANANIQSDTVAGGLFGTLTDSDVDDCYSTASASGPVAGGFSGNSENSSIKNSYATGYVDGSIRGIFAGSIATTTLESNTYYWAASQYKDNEETADVDESVVPTIGSEENDSITPFDLNVQTYRDFVGSDRKKSWPYDAHVIANYSDEYPLRGVESPSEESEEESADVDPADQNQSDETESGQIEQTFKPYAATTHYGDWPTPETLINNERDVSSLTYSPRLKPGGTEIQQESPLRKRWEQSGRI